MRTTRFQRITLPLRQALPVRGVFVSEREVLRIEGADADGRLFFADCGPLPGLHSESLADCEKALEEGVHVGWQNQDPKRPFAETPLKSLKTALELLHLLPSTREFRLERRDPCRNSQLLSLPQSGNEEAFLSGLDAARPVLKIKVGRQDLGRERELLQETVKRLPGASLRLDANQGFSRAQFIDCAKAFRDLPLAYYEEPCADSEALADLCAEYPIALDESLLSTAELRRRAAAWVIKPNLYGFNETLELLAAGIRQRKPLILSNAFESPATLQSYAWFYGLLVPQAEAFGFGTADYMDEELGLWNPNSSLWPETPGGQL